MLVLFKLFNSFSSDRNRQWIQLYVKYGVNKFVQLDACSTERITTEVGVTGLCCLKISHLIATALSAFLFMAKRHLEWILCEQTPRNMITLS